MNPVQFQAQQPQAIQSQVIYPPQQNYGFFTQVLPQLFQMAGVAKELISGNPLQEAQVNTERTRNTDYYLRYINESDDPQQRQDRYNQMYAKAKQENDESALAALGSMDPSKMNLDQQGRNQQFKETSQLAQWSSNGQQQPSSSTGVGSGDSPTQQAISAPGGQPGVSSGQPPQGGASPAATTPESGGQTVPNSGLGPPSGPPPISSEIPGGPQPRGAATGPEQMQTGALPDGQSATEFTPPPQNELLMEVARKTGVDVNYLYTNQEGYPLVKPEAGAMLGAPLAAMVQPPPPGPEDPVIKQAVASVQPQAQDWVRTFGRANLWNKFVTKQPLDDADLFAVSVGSAQADMFLREAAAKAGYMDQKDFDPQMMLYLADGLKPNGTRGEGFVQAINWLNTIPPTAKKFSVEMAGTLAQYDLNYAKLAEEAWQNRATYTTQMEANNIRRLDVEAQQIWNERRYGQGGLEDQKIANTTRQVDAYTRNVDLKNRTYTVLINGQEYTGTKDELDLAVKGIQVSLQSDAAQQRTTAQVGGMLKALAGINDTQIRASAGQMTGIRSQMQEVSAQRQQAVGLLAKKKTERSQFIAANPQLVAPKKKTETDQQYEQRVANTPAVAEYNAEIKTLASDVAGYDEVIGQVPQRDSTGKMVGGTGLRQELWNIQEQLNARSGSSGQIGSILAQASDEYIRTGRIGEQTLKLLQTTQGTQGGAVTPGGTVNPAAGTTTTSGGNKPPQAGGGKTIMSPQEFVAANRATYPNHTLDQWKQAYAEYKKKMGVK